MRKLAPPLFATLLGLLASTAAAMPEVIHFTGRVFDGSGPIDGTVAMAFRFYDTETIGSGALLWEESHTAVPADQGLVMVEFGRQNPLDASIFESSDVWLEIVVESVVQSPRITVGTVPYALVAGTCERVGGFASDDLQVRVADSCPDGSSMRAIDAVGTVTCETDDDTTYTNGTGLTLAGNAFSVDFGGNGSASTAARSDHNHDGVYVTGYSGAGGVDVSGTTISLSTNGCTSGEVWKWTGADWSCEPDDNTTYTDGNGLTLADNTFSVDFGGNGSASTAARSDHNHDGVYVTGGPYLPLAGGTMTGALTSSANFTQTGTTADITVADDLFVGDNLTVADNVTADNYLYTTARTYSRSYSGVSFSGARGFLSGVGDPADIENWAMDGYIYSSRVGSQDSYYLVARITEIPNGATITGLTCYRYDNDATYNMTSYHSIRRRGLTAATFDENSHVILSSSTSGMATQVLATNSGTGSLVVDYTNNMYIIYSYLSGFGGSSEIRFYGCRVTYTVAGTGD